MIRNAVLAGIGLGLLATMAAADVAQRMLQPCLDATDLAFSAGRMETFEDRWSKLARYIGNESQCLSTVLARCAASDAAATCFAEVQEFAQHEAAMATAGWADRLNAPEKIADSYAAWMEALRNGAWAGSQPCALPGNFPPEACPALQAGQVMLEARQWARMKDELESLR